MTISKAALPKADVITSLLMIVLGSAVVAGASRMPLSGEYGGKPIYWYTSPGFFPMTLGACIIVVACAILIRAIRERAMANLVPWIVSELKSLPRSIVARRMALGWVLMGAYIGLLSLHPFGALSQFFERLTLMYSPYLSFMVDPEGANYVVSSFLFLFVFMGVYYRPAQTQSRGRYWTTVAVLSVLFAWGVGFAFTQHLQAPLPWLNY